MAVSPGDFQLTLIRGRLRSVAGWIVNDSLHQLKALVLGAKNRTGRGERAIWRGIKLKMKLRGAKVRVKRFCWHRAGKDGHRWGAEPLKVTSLIKQRAVR